MGDRMMCVTTPKTGVTQGDANTHENRCVTTTTPKGGWGGGDAASPVRRGVVHDLRPRGRLQVVVHMSAPHIKAVLLEFCSCSRIFQTYREHARAA